MCVCVFSWDMEKPHSVCVFKSDFLNSFTVFCMHSRSHSRRSEPELFTLRVYTNFLLCGASLLLKEDAQPLAMLLVLPSINGSAVFAN